MASPGTIVILTGAGISAESGLSTFRDEGGLWAGHRIEDVATPGAYRRDPGRVHAFYNERRRQLKTTAPNAAHDALARLAAEWPGDVVLITQNVDDLHQRAAKETPPAAGFRLYPMHGELRKIRCAETETVYPWQDDCTAASPSPDTGRSGSLRPHIVWFGEMPFYMDEIQAALLRADLFLSIGTSGNVYPAAGFVEMLRHVGRAHTVELNMEPSAGSRNFEETHYGPATALVPGYVERILAGDVI